MSVLPSSIAVLALLAATPAFPYVETADLDWVTTPVVERLAQRLGPLAANRDRSASEEREFRALSKIYSRLRGPSERLADEFRELEAAATGLRGVRDDAGSLGAALTTAIDRAAEQLSLRRGTVEDHVVLLPDGRARRGIADRLAAAGKLEAKAASKQRPDRRAPLLRRAERLLTAALVAADAEAERFDVERPAPRVRNGTLVGSAGGRVVVPEDGSALAGVDVTLQPGTVGSSVRLLVQEVPWTWAWPEAPVAPVLRIGEAPWPPAELPRPLRVSFRYDAAHVGDPTLAVTAGSFGAPAVPDAVFGADGRVAFEVPSFGVVAARRILPPPGHPEFPAERYHVVLAIGRATSAASSTGEALDGIVEQDFTFGPGPTGSTADGTLAAVERCYVAAAPRHEDSARTATVPGDELYWSLRQSGPSYSRSEYTITFRLEGDVLTGTGLLSRDGALTVFTARGESTAAIGFGVRDDAAASAADLAKPWFVGVQGVRLGDDESADFMETRTVGIAAFVPDGAEGLVPAAGETVFGNSLRIRSDVFPAVYSEARGAVAPDALSSVSLGADGRLVADGGRTTGWMHGASGLLVARSFDPSSATATLLLGVRDDGGEFDELFAPGIPEATSPPWYATLAFRASTEIRRWYETGLHAEKFWGTTWMNWRRHDPFGPQVLADLTGWPLGWMTLSVGEDDGAPAWEIGARAGFGSGYPHAEEGWLEGPPPAGRTVRRREIAAGGDSIVVSPDGGTILVCSIGRLGLGVLPRE